MDPRMRPRHRWENIAEGTRNINPKHVNDAAHRMQMLDAERDFAEEAEEQAKLSRSYARLAGWHLKKVERLYRGALVLGRATLITVALLVVLEVIRIVGWWWDR